MTTGNGFVFKLRQNVIITLGGSRELVVARSLFEMNFAFDLTNWQNSDTL